MTAAPRGERPSLRAAVLRDAADQPRQARRPRTPRSGSSPSPSPYDPEPSLRIEDGRVVELDGKAEAEFDLIDEFIARRGIDLAVAEEAMALDDVAFARMLVDAGVPRARDHAPRRAA